jgi:hypothetical protein
VLEDIDLNEQRAATTKLATTRMNIAMEIFWRRRRGLYVARLQCLIYSSYFHGRVHRHLYCWTLVTEPDDQPTDEERCLLLKMSIVCWTYYFFLFFLRTNLVCWQNRLFGTAFQVLTLSLWENLSRLTSSRLTSPVSEPPTT